MNGSIHAQQAKQSWKTKFEKGSFESLEKELDSVIQMNRPEKQAALQLLGDLYKVRGDVETAYFYWKQSDSVLISKAPGLDSKAIELAHLSNFYYEKFNPENASVYNDSLIGVVSQLRDFPIEEVWIWNVIAQSNKLALDKHNGPILSKTYDEKVFPYYLKGIEVYKSDPEFLFDLARTYHLYANAHVDLVHVFSYNDRNSLLVSKLEQKANQLYDKASAIYKTLYGSYHYEIARIGYVKALLYQYAHPNPDPIEFENTINLFETALSVFNIKEASKVLNISEALGCVKQYHRALYQEYRLTSNLELKGKQDSIFNLSNKLWEVGLHSFQTNNPNQLISLYGLSPFSERIYQLYYEYQVMGVGKLDTVFRCLQQLKYRDKPHQDQTRRLEVYSAHEVQQKLNAKQCYIAFSIAPEPFALFISKDNIRLKPIDIKRSEIHSFSQSIKQMDFDTYVVHAAELYEKIIEEIDLQKFEELIISPSGWFNEIPFQALLVSNLEVSHNDYRKLDYLINHLEIKYVFSARDLVLNRTKERKWNIDLFLPDYKNEMALPFAQRFGKGFDYASTRFYGKDANKSRFLDSKASILHYSGHGKGSSEQREFSQLLLNEGNIELRDIYSSKLQSDLVVLNACSSGKGVFNAGDGVDGFPRAFYMKGIAQVLSSFWDLDDRASHQVMETFYRNLSEGVGSNTALRGSQRAFISNAKNSNQAAPYYWAGHQLYGVEQRFEKQVDLGVEERGIGFWWLFVILACLSAYIFLRIRSAKS